MGPLTLQYSFDISVLEISVIKVSDFLAKFASQAPYSSPFLIRAKNSEKYLPAKELSWGAKRRQVVQPSISIKDCRERFHDYRGLLPNISAYH